MCIPNRVLIVCWDHIIVRSDRVPTIILLLNHEDADMVVSGVLSLKGCEVHKSETVNDCLSLLNRDDKVDVVLTKHELAMDKDFMLVRNIRKISPDIMIMVLSDSTKEELKADENGIDEFVVPPISPENLTDKVLMLVAKKELKKMKKR